MTDLHARAEAIAAGMTKGPWRADPCWSQFYLPPNEIITWSHERRGDHFVTETRLAEQNYKPDADKQGICLLANLRHELLAVVRAADANGPYPCICEHQHCTLCNLKSAIAAYDAALNRELGGEP